MYEEVGASGDRKRSRMQPCRTYFLLKIVETLRNFQEVGWQVAAPDQCRQPPVVQRLGALQQRLRLCGGPPGRSFDGCVARATTDVPVESGNGLLWLGRLRVEQETGERQHHAGSAKAALTCSLIHDCPLYGCRIGSGEPLDGDQVLASHASKDKHAGGDGFVADLIPLKRAQKDSAGAAVSFAAALLGAGQPADATQVVQDEDPGR